MNTLGSGIPNWKDRDAYLKYVDIHDRSWRWEFLRRDPDYQRAWERAEKTDLSEWRVPAREDKQLSENLFRLHNLFDPKMVRNRIGDAFIVRGGSTFKYLKSEDALELIDKLNIPPESQMDFLRSIIKDVLVLSDAANDGDLSLAIFDLNRPLAEQLKNIKHLLEGQQKYYKEKLIPFRKHKKLWPRYLRMLDAQAQGDPGAMEIHKHLLHEAEQHDVYLYDEMNVDNPATLVSDWQTAANEVRNKAIRYL